jgi:hypothetical protein
MKSGKNEADVYRYYMDRFARHRNIKYANASIVASDEVGTIARKAIGIRSCNLKMVKHNGHNGGGDNHKK